MRFSHQCSVVTGAASGIGREVARLLAQEGAAVAVADIDLDRAKKVEQEIVGEGGTALALAADVGDELATEAMTSRARAEIGPIDILVNCASNVPSDDILTMTPADWDRDIRTTLRGVYLCTRSVLPSMIERRSGCIINVASVNGLAFYGNEAYSAAKAGVISLTLATAVRYGAFGIRANAVAPGTIRTPMWDARLALDPQLFDRAARWYPLHRVGEPRDVAAAVVFLASADAGWITGAILPVDGGLSAGNYRMTAELVVESQWDGIG
jgi:meso-butanediol dehydrogenase/(S,S)-butanediol dehydrogenase/diacetyl reductase